MKMQRRLFLGLMSTMLGSAARAGRAPAAEQDAGSAHTHTDEDDMFNVVTPTLGGKQFWADQLWFRDWRIQQNVFTGHCRLIDDKNLRRAWGTFDDCRARLDTFKRELSLQPLSGRAVIVLHGLIRTRTASGGMIRFLREQGGLTAIGIGYPSTRAAIDDHAASLGRVLENLDGIDEINFVAHSLGNIVIRRYLAMAAEPRQAESLTAVRPGEDAAQAALHPAPPVDGRVPRIGRIVMIGAPNQGAEMAKLLGGYSLFRMVAGPAGQALGTGWGDFSAKLATPDCEFGVIAGGRGDGRGYSPLLRGDNDLVVTVEEARLPGASDFLLVPMTHTFMMEHRAVQEATLRFLNEGYFTSAAARRPIAREKQP